MGSHWYELKEAFLSRSSRDQGLLVSENYESVEEKLKEKASGNRIWVSL